MSLKHTVPFRLAVSSDRDLHKELLVEYLEVVNRHYIHP